MIFNLEIYVKRGNILEVLNKRADCTYLRAFIWTYSNLIYLIHNYLNSTYTYCLYKFII